MCRIVKYIRYHICNVNHVNHFSNISAKYGGKTGERFKAAWVSSRLY